MRILTEPEGGMNEMMIGSMGVPTIIFVLAVVFAIVFVIISEWNSRT